MSNTEEIIEALDLCAEVLPYAITDDETKWDGEVRSVIGKVRRALALLADMEGQQEPTDEQIECEANEWREGSRGVTATHRIAFAEGAQWARGMTHPSPQPSVDVAEIIKCGDAMAFRLSGTNTGDGLRSVWKELTKHHRP